MNNFPKDVKIVEVGPRDGFQSIKKWIPTKDKLEIIESLIDSNIKKMEVTSFVNPKAIPQLQDAKKLINDVLAMGKSIELNALVPNYRGAKDAWDSGIGEITYVISASERHNLENVRKTKEDSFEELKRIREDIPELKVKFDIATVFGCPFLGDVPVEQVLEMIDTSINSLGIDEICLCDTIGIANPAQTDDILKAVVREYPDAKLSAHFHDTRGMALANTLIAMGRGIDTFEAAIGGLGGCPFAPGAAGNVATEDLVYMMESMNIKTGVNLEKLLDTAKIVQAKILPDLTGHMVNVCYL
jgi:hydroxymethylglutaryl-CoA lyase